MNEAKSWASSETAEEAHALFQCLAHNLALLLEEEIKKEEGREDRLETKKRAGRLETRTNRESTPLKRVRNFINSVFERATQRTVRFLRWLRAWVYREAPWRAAIARLAHVWAC